MPGYSSRIVNQKSVLTYSQFPYRGVNFSNSFFPLMTRKWNMLHQQLKGKNIDEFKTDLKNKYKPKRYKFYSRGDKYKCSLLTRIRVGRSYLNEHSFTLGFSPTMACEKCNNRRESPLHFIVQCDYYNDLRLVMLNKVKQFIPDIHLLPQKRQFEILTQGFDIDNDDLIKYNTKIMIATQCFIYDTKRFHIKKQTHLPTNPPIPVPPLPAPILPNM